MQRQILRQAPRALAMKSASTAFKASPLVLSRHFSTPVPVKQTNLFINGEFVPSITGKTFETFNPATEEKIADVAEAGTADIDAAVAAARSAFEGEWRTMPASERGRLIHKLADLIEENIDELAALEALDNGKPCAEAKGADLGLVLKTLRYYAGWPDKIHGAVIPITGPYLCYNKSEPVGVCAQIIPWNFPLLMMAWKLGPALAAGNTIVLKPAEQTPLSALRVGELIAEAGFPKGVINIVPGVGPTAGRHLAQHPNVDKVAFTGSTEVGYQIMRTSHVSNIKRVTLELGGKSANIILDDADIDLAIQQSQLGLFLNQGQCCIAGTRVYVQEGIYDEFVRRSVEAASARVVGDPFSSATQQGAQIDETQFEKILGYIDEGVKEGARLLTGGKRHGDKGWFIQPTVFADVTDDMTIAREEIFGPVMSILKFKTIDEVIERANDSVYGLGAGVVTKNIDNAIKIVGTAALYTTLRPRDIPGSEAAAVPPPTYGEGGVFRPPQFPSAKSREEQIAQLKRSAGVVSQVAEKAKKWLGGGSTPTPAEKAEEEPYDLLVIGGGATGAGIALDAVTRGLKVALVERDDFSSGTSSKSTKLVHGGVRYLEKAVWNLDYNQYALVVEALRERRYFLDTAPHLSQWLPIMIPIQKWWQAPYFWAGTKFYDFLAGSENIESSYYMTKSKALDAFPMLKKEGLVGALVYYDGAHNDSRMNVSIAMTAALYGATVVNHLEVTSLEKDANGRLCGAKAKDCIAERDGKKAEEFSIKAKGIINATGPFTDSIRKMDDQEVPEIVAPSSGVHVILPGYYSPANMGLIDPNTSDGRVIFFLPWQGNTIAGTTDTACDIKRDPVAGEEEIDWILKEVKRYLQPEINVRRGDVLAAWSGIRPLVRDPNASATEGLVRNHLVTTSPSGLMTCSGGKWTTYRQMAEETVDEAIKEYSLKTQPLVNPTLVSGTEVKDEAPLDGTCQTHRVRLVGAHGFSKTLFINLIQHYGIETDVAKYLCQAYGDRAWTVAALASPTEQRFPVRGIKMAELYPYIDGEVRYCVRHEYAQTATDVIARRMRLAFLNAQAALEALPKVIDIMGEELKWDNKRKEVEWKNSITYLGSMGLPKNKLSLTRKDVESGHVGKYTDEDYHLYARHDKPDELLQSDSKFPSGHNPVVGRESKVNK